jgi:hypothetical protein
LDHTYLLGKRIPVLLRGNTLLRRNTFRAICVLRTSGIAAPGVVRTLIVVEHTAAAAALCTIAIGYIVGNAIPVIGAAGAARAPVVIRVLTASALVFPRFPVFHK